VARQTLAGLGYRVLCAGDGEEALRLCEQHKPDVAVLDVVMPKPGGLTTAERLLNHFPGLRLIFASGYSHHHDVRTCRCVVPAEALQPGASGQARARRAGRKQSAKLDRLAVPDVFAGQKLGA